MNQISINTVPTIPKRIPKKLVEISWLSDVIVVRDTNSLDSEKQGSVAFENLDKFSIKDHLNSRETE
jgi:hypothetical protein